MSLQEYIIHRFKTWKPPAPVVTNRTSREVTLTFSAGPFTVLNDGLLYRVERKEKIPAWVVVYSGGKTTKTIENLAPCQPHRFRLQIIIRPTTVIDLAERLLRHYGDEATVRTLLSEASDSEDKNHKKDSNLNEEDKANLNDEAKVNLNEDDNANLNEQDSANSNEEDKAYLNEEDKANLNEDDNANLNKVDKANLNKKDSFSLDSEKLLSPNVFKQGTVCTNKDAKQENWLESSWSEETWTGTDSEGTSAACFGLAVRCGYLKQVQQMVQERPLLVSIINYSNGYTPLATAVRAGEVNMVKFLLSANAEIEQRSSTGQTPLHLAVLSGHIAVADLLLERGADFLARDLNQLGVEHYAVDSCKLEVVQFVFNRGGDVSVRDSNGWTPLFRAVCQGAKTELIEELVRRGSDLEVVDRAHLAVPAVARLLTDRHGRRRESVLRLVDEQFQREKVVANFTRLTKKISSFHTLFKH